MHRAAKAGRRLSGNLIVVFNILMKESREAGTNLFTLVISDSTQENRMKLSQGRFRLHIRKSFFTQSVAEHWNRLPKEDVTAPSLTEFNNCSENHSQAHGVILHMFCVG